MRIGYSKEFFLGNRTQNVIAFLLLTLVTIFLARGLLFSSGTILYGDFVPTLTKDKFIGMYYPTWTENGMFNLNGLPRLAYLSIFSLPFYIINLPSEIYFKLLIVSTLIMAGDSPLNYLALLQRLPRRSLDRPFDR